MAQKIDTKCAQKEGVKSKKTASTKLLAEFLLLTRPMIVDIPDHPSRRSPILCALLFLLLCIGPARPAFAQFLEKAEFEGGFERAATDGPRKQWDHPTYCRLVIDLSLSRTGKVLSSEVNVPLSTCSDPAIVAKAKALALTYVFTPNGDAPEPQAARFTWGIGERPKYAYPFADDPGPEMLPSPPAEAESERTWTVVEVPPQFPGGPATMKTYLERMVKYPTDAEPPFKEGMVLVGFVVNTEGLVEEVNVIKGLGYPYDAEARRVVKAMPKWIPGMQNGHPVRTRFEIPVAFNRPSGAGTTGEGSGSGAGRGTQTHESITMELTGRTVTKAPKVDLEAQESGRVVMDIWVDRSGKVLRAQVGRGTTTTAKSLVDAARKAALASRFSDDPRAPEEQQGKATFRFDLE